MNIILFIAFGVVVVFSQSYCSGAAIVGEDDFQIGDNWVYADTNFRSTNIWTSKGFHTIRVIGKLVISDQVNYVSQETDSGKADSVVITYDTAGKRDTAKGSTTYYSTSIDTNLFHPFRSFSVNGNISISDTVKLVAYKGDTLLMDVGYAGRYLQKIGFLSYYLWMGTPSNHSYRILDLVSHNGVPFDPSALKIIGAVPVQHSVFRDQPILRPNIELLCRGLTLKNIPPNGIDNISVFSANGRLICMNNVKGENEILLKNFLSRGIYYVRINTGSFQLGEKASVVK